MYTTILLTTFFKLRLQSNINTAISDSRIKSGYRFLILILIPHPPLFTLLQNTLHDRAVLYPYSTTVTFSIVVFSQSPPPLPHSLRLLGYVIPLHSLLHRWWICLCRLVRYVYLPPSFTTTDAVTSVHAATVYIIYNSFPASLSLIPPPFYSAVLIISYRHITPS